jgi:hypothetical protein
VLASRVGAKVASAKAKAADPVEALASAIARKLASPRVVASAAVASRLASAVRGAVASPARTADVGETLK